MGWWNYVTNPIKYLNHPKSLWKPKWIPVLLHKFSIPRYPPLQPMQPMHYYPPQHMHGLPASWLLEFCLSWFYPHVQSIYTSCSLQAWFLHISWHCFKLLWWQGHKCTTLMHRIRTILATLCQSPSQQNLADTRVRLSVELVEFEACSCHAPASAQDGPIIESQWEESFIYPVYYIL